MGRHTSSSGECKRAVLHFLMALIPFTKPHATAAQRVAHLRARGLIITRPSVAARKIELIGYERLRIYFLSRRDPSLPNRPFLPGTTYHDILRLYQCDMEIRSACFAAVGAFELLFRNAFSEALSHANGSHPYYDHSLFKDAAANLEALRYFVGVFEKSKDQRARHYKQRYGSPVLPPIWTLKEFLTFGASSRLYQCLEGSIRTAIARQFGIASDAIFKDWVECLVDLRNICAHHDRLFNRRFQKQPPNYRRAGVPTASVHTLKAILECLDHLLDSAGASAHITNRIERIIRRFPEMQLSEAGY